MQHVSPRGRRGAHLGCVCNCRTAETFQDGWVRTGDEVYINELKELFIVDRIKVRVRVRVFWFRSI